MNSRKKILRATYLDDQKKIFDLLNHAGNILDECELTHNVETADLTKSQKFVSKNNQPAKLLGGKCIYGNDCDEIHIPLYPGKNNNVFTIRGTINEYSLLRIYYRARTQEISCCLH